MKSKFKKLFVTVLLVGTIIGSSSAFSYAAGFWNYTRFELQFMFASESCPWALRWACGEVYVISPYHGGPGHKSSNNTAGTVELGGIENNVLTDGSRVYYSREHRTIEVGKQDWIEFTLEQNVLKMKIHRNDTGRVEFEELTIANLKSR